MLPDLTWCRLTRAQSDEILSPNSVANSTPDSSAARSPIMTRSRTGTAINPPDRYVGLVFGAFGVFTCHSNHDFLDSVNAREQNGGKLVSIATIVRQT